MKRLNRIWRECFLLNDVPISEVCLLFVMCWYNSIELKFFFQSFQFNILLKYLYPLPYGGSSIINETLFFELCSTVFLKLWYFCHIFNNVLIFISLAIQPDNQSWAFFSFSSYSFRFSVNLLDITYLFCIISHTLPLSILSLFYQFLLVDELYLIWSHDLSS